MHITRLILWLLALAVPLAAHAAGIPEPSLVMYGVVTDASGIRQTNGVLEVTIQRPDGFPPLVLRSTLSDLNNQYSYALHIPCESELAGFPVTAVDRLRLVATPTTFNRATVRFRGAPIPFVTPAQSSFSVASVDRGRLERVDFSLVVDSDLDTNGLLKSWQRQYFGRLGVDPLDDPDRDGMPNIAEMRAGTDPTNSSSNLSFTQIVAVQTGQIRVLWSSVQGRSYRILRSSNLGDGYRPVSPVQTATAPANSYTDTTAAGDGPFFYRVQVEAP